jgi:predicted HTH domain antitoxin
MARVRVEFEVSSKTMRGLRRRDFARAVKQQAVLQLVRERKISQGRGAELLRMTREEFFDLMRKQQVPHIQLTREELAEDRTVAERAIRDGSL